MEYKKFGFWTRDSYLSNWTTVFIEEINQLPVIEGWQQRMTEHWLVQIEIDGGCMSMNLDEFLADDAKKNVVLSLAQACLRRCAESCKRTGELFIELLSGRLKTTVSSPIDYFGD